MLYTLYLHWRAVNLSKLTDVIIKQCRDVVVLFTVPMRQTRESHLPHMQTFYLTAQRFVLILRSSRETQPSSLTLLILVNVNVKEPYVLVEGKTRLRVAAPRHRRLTRRIMLFIVRRISEKFKNLRLRPSRSGRVYSRVKQSFDDSVERDLDTRCSCRHDGC